MLERVKAAVAAAAKGEGVEYVDARFFEDELEQILMRSTADGKGMSAPEAERLIRTRSEGFGVRVLYRGAWGFGARPGRDEAAAAQAAADALAVARAAAQVNTTKVRLSEEEPQRGRWDTPVEVDPFQVPLEDKLAELTRAVSALTGAADPRIKTAQARMLFRRVKKTFASSEGSATEQDLMHGAAGLKVIAADESGVEQRSYPMDQDGGVGGCGYELISRLDLAGRAPQLRDEVLGLLSAPMCPAGATTMILDPAQLALQIHESCGHPTESDRAMGEEVSLAGASFLTPDRLGRFRYGSERVNLVADSLTPGGLGTHGWDDAGVPARRTPLVSRGQFVGYLSSRESAAKLGLGRSAGCLRAETWSRVPIIRMINVSLDPDPAGPSYDELIADTDDGILMGNNKSWSIDDLRLNFQFGCEIAWEIKHGKRGRMFRKPVYTGITPRFWGGMDAVGRPDEFRMFGFLSCGKGDPMQIMYVGHGCAPARFRGVDVRSGS